MLVVQLFIDGQKMKSQFTSSIFQKINIPEKEKTIILIGKDGEVKQRYGYDVKLKKIFSDIDVMPMRKNEIKIRKKSKNN